MKIIDKLKEILFPKGDADDMEDEEAEKELPRFDINSVMVIHVNPNVYLAHKAARICIGKDVNPNIEERMSSLENIVNVRKHESITEHTNVVVLYTIPNDHISQYCDQYTEFLSNLRYCHCISRKLNDSKQLLLVGGSVRAFMHALRETNNNNFFLQYVKETVYNSFESCFFKNFIDADILEEEKCTYFQDAITSLIPSKVTQVKNDKENTNEENYDVEAESVDPKVIESTNVDLVYLSPIEDIYNKIKEYGFTMKDVYKVSTLSFIFHDISRSCSHQLVRHRNAISQESQRYVSHKYTNDDFINPIKMMKEERYGDSKYRDVFTKIKSMDLFTTYKYLIYHNIHKEDARAFLPTNVKTKLMMTMTYENYAYFLKLRLDKAAQKEIRNVAEESVELTMDPFRLEDFIEYLTNPFFSRKEELMDPLMKHYSDSTQVDEEEVVEYKEPSLMNIDSQDKAQELLDQQEKYNQMEDERK